jgi:hypothetical protein
MPSSGADEQKCGATSKTLQTRFLAALSHVTAAISVNRGEADATNEVKSVSHVHVVQDSRRAKQDPDRPDEGKDERKERR